MSTEKTAPAKVEKHPELRKLFNALMAEKVQIMTKVDPLAAEREKLLASIAPVLAKIKVIETEKKKFNPRLAELDNQLSVIAGAMGGRKMSQPAETPEA